MQKRIEFIKAELKRADSRVAEVCYESSCLIEILRFNVLFNSPPNLLTLRLPLLQLEKQVEDKKGILMRLQVHTPKP